MTKSEYKALITGTELLSPSVPHHPPLLLPPNSSALQKKMIKDRAEVSLAPKRDGRPYIPLRGCPGNIWEGLKSFMALLDISTQVITLLPCPTEGGTSRFS